MLEAADPGWCAFAEEHALSPTQRPGWLSVLTGAYGLRARIAALVVDDGGILAGLPMVAAKLPWRDRWSALPYTDLLDVVALGEEHRHALLLALAESARDETILMHADAASVPGWFSRQLATMQVLEVSGGATEVLSGVSSSTKRHVARARRASAGLEASLVEDRSEFMGATVRLMAETRRRLGAPTQPLRYWGRIWELHARGEAVTIGVRLEGRLLACAVFLLGRRHAVYKYGASDLATRHLRTNYLVFAAAFDELAGRGIRTLDFGLSDLENEGLRSFKARWGGEERIVRFSATDPAALPRSLEPGRLVTGTIQRAPLMLGRMIGAVGYPLLA